MQLEYCTSNNKYLCIYFIFVVVLNRKVNIIHSHTFTFTYVYPYIHVHTVCLNFFYTILDIYERLNICLYCYRKYTHTHVYNIEGFFTFCRLQELWFLPFVMHSKTWLFGSVWHVSFM